MATTYDHATGSVMIGRSAEEPRNPHPPVVEGGRQGDHLRHPVVALLASVQPPDLLPVVHVDDVDGGGAHIHAVHVDEEAQLDMEQRDIS